MFLTALWDKEEVELCIVSPEFHIVDVKPDRAVQTTVSTVAGKLPENGGASNHFGDSGGQQWRIQEDLTKSKQYEK